MFSLPHKVRIILKMRRLQVIDAQSQYKEKRSGRASRLRTCEHDPEISEAAKGCSMYMTAACGKLLANFPA